MRMSKLKNITIYNKLVRDKIPQIIESEGKTCEYDIISKDKLPLELCHKLFEETNELKDAIKSGEAIERITEELADVATIVNILRYVLGISNDEFLRVYSKKAKEKGEFIKGIYLKSVEEE